MEGPFISGVAYLSVLFNHVKQCCNRTVGINLRGDQYRCGRTLVSTISGSRLLVVPPIHEPVM